MKNENNAYIYVVENGEFKNLICVLTLNNGKKVKFQIKESFFNRKFDYLVKSNLDILKKDNK